MFQQSLTAREQSQIEGCPDLFADSFPEAGMTPCKDHAHTRLWADMARQVGRVIRTGKVDQKHDRGRGIASQTPGESSRDARTNHRESQRTGHVIDIGLSYRFSRFFSSLDRCSFERASRSTRRHEAVQSV